MLNAGNFLEKLRTVDQFSGEVSWSVDSIVLRWSWSGSQRNSASSVNKVLELELKWKWWIRNLMLSCCVVFVGTSSAPRESFILNSQEESSCRKTRRAKTNFSQIDTKSSWKTQLFYLFHFVRIQLTKHKLKNCWHFHTSPEKRKQLNISDSTSFNLQWERNKVDESKISLGLGSPFSSFAAVISLNLCRYRYRCEARKMIRKFFFSDAEKFFALFPSNSQH